LRKSHACDEQDRGKRHIPHPSLHFVSVGAASAAPGFYHKLGFGFASAIT